MERVVRPGGFYRHFKNKLYQIVTVAKHSETGEELVIYQALYGDFSTYARPLPMFISEVDRDKYPDCPQKYRFEQVMGPELADSVSATENRVAAAAGSSETECSGPVAELRPTDPGVDENSADKKDTGNYLLRFFETDLVDERLKILDEMKGHVGNAEIESICMVLEISNRPGSIEEQLDEIRKALVTKQRYDGSRLRS